MPGRLQHAPTFPPGGAHGRRLQVRNLAAQNLARQQEREREMLRQKYLTKPLSEIVSGDTEVGRSGRRADMSEQG